MARTNRTVGGRLPGNPVSPISGPDKGAGARTSYPIPGARQMHYDPERVSAGGPGFVYGTPEWRGRRTGWTPAPPGSPGVRFQQISPADTGKAPVALQDPGKQIWGRPQTDLKVSKFNPASNAPVASTLKPGGR